MRRKTFLGAALLVAMAGLASAQQPDLSGRLDKAIEGLVTRGLSGVVLVYKDGKVIHQSAHGMAEPSSGRANTLRTLFDTGSVTKQFTAAATLKLEAQGKLQTSDTLGKLLKGVPDDKAGITVLQLLSHTSGFSRMYKLRGVDLRKRDAMVAGVLSQKLTGKPGERFEYSNLNYFLLSAVVGKAAGKSFEAYLKEALFSPAKMTDTGFCGDRSLDMWRAARRFADGRDVGSMVDYWYAWGHRGATGVVTTALDLLKWHKALSTDTVLPKAARDKLFTPVKGNYGCGWYVLPANERGPKTIMHSGSAAGSRAMIQRFPGKDTAVIVLTNKTQGQRDLMHWTVANTIKGILFPPK